MKIIAESAFNHNGSLEYLIQLADEAKKTNADYFTVQVMNVASFCVQDYSKYEIYENNTLRFDEWQILFDYCKKINLPIIPCVLDMPSFEYCYTYGFRFLKLHATDITNVSMLVKMAAYDDISLILETQCATNFELKFALKYIGDKVECIMHGFSHYPTEVEDLNLNSLDYLKEEFPMYKTGMADHSLDTSTIPLMILAKGCDYIEKHITLTRNNRNFDYQVSLYPYEFASMVSIIRHYENALGIKHKHPTKNELFYRNVMYKKALSNEEFKRSDSGKDFISSKFESFNKKNVGVALIARLKSKRLPLKVLKPFHDTVLIDFLYKRLESSKAIQSCVLATSSLDEDFRLVENAKNKGQRVFTGHAISVIDRMLELSFQEEYGGVFRVTGDNPFTDIDLMDQMVEMFRDNNLDYVRVNNVPFGVSAELFSTNYLWNLYLKMENPLDSEYLTLFVLKDDEARKGCIDIKSSIKDLKYINLSVDYERDYMRALSLLDNLKKKVDPYGIKFADMACFLNALDREDSTKKIKLPQSEDILFSEFLERLENQIYVIRKKVQL